jgi:hypothetical protein
MGLGWQLDLTSFNQQNDKANNDIDLNGNLEVDLQILSILL